MIKFSEMRTLINNGWTIANRKAIASRIGKSNFAEIHSLAKSVNMLTTVKYTEAIPYLNQQNMQKTKQTLLDILESYREFARSPYINNSLRNNISLSEQSKKIVNSLQQAISHNRVSGKFIRGITPTRTNKLETIDDVSAFIFNNKGFTSAVPEINADYANCFALGRNGTKVIFDVKNFPGYKANNYEVLFDTNAFTKDKFDIIKEGERLFLVVEKQYKAR